MAANNTLTTVVPEGHLPASTKQDFQNTSAGIHVHTIDEAITLAKTFAASGMFKDTKNANECVVKILMGREFGFTPVAAMSAIHIVQGKMMLSGVAIGTLIKRHRNYRYRVLESTDKVCRIEFFERLDGEWQSSGIEEFTDADAKRQQTQNMQKFPKNMLFNRAMSNGAKMHCPDVFGGQPVYTEGEIEEPQTPPAPSLTGRGGDVKSRLTQRVAPKEDPIEAEIISPEIESRRGEVLGAPGGAKDIGSLEEEHFLEAEEAEEIRQRCERKGIDYAETLGQALADGKVGFSALLPLTAMDAQENLL